MFGYTEEQIAQFGVTFGVGTVYVLVVNGAMLGGYSGSFGESGLGRELWLTILPHGALELSAIIVAGAAGLLIGFGLWCPGRRTRLRTRALVALGRGPVAWIDIDPRKVGNRVSGAPVHAPAWLRDRPVGSRPFVLVYVASHGARDQVAAVLRRYGYRRGRDWLGVG